MPTFREFLEAELPGARISELSDTNSLVYRVDSDGEVVVAKHVLDSDIPLSYLAEANAALARSIPVQRIRQVWETARGDPFDAVLADYVAGRDLATALIEGAGAPPTGQLVDYLCRFAVVCRELPRLHDGFGLYKREAPVIAGQVEFVEHYAGRYWSRVRPFYHGTRVGAAVDDWLSGGFASAAARHPAPDTTVCIDANLRNFIVTPDRQIVLLNVPIVGRSVPAQAVGAISAHLRHREPYRPFLDAAAARVCPDDAELVPHFELWALLGIMSFYAVREPDRQYEWRNWGSPVTLDEDFRDLVRTHLIPAEAR